MDGCPHCTNIKDEFKKNNIVFIDRDINEYEDEYNQFVSVVKNEYVPSLILLTLDDKNESTDVKFLTPDNDYNTIYEAVEIVKKYLLN